MDRRYRCSQVTTNFDSAYNTSLKYTPQPTIYIPITPVTSCCCTLTSRPTSPLFSRCSSPPSRRPISTGSRNKFNFDLYKMNEIDDKYDTYRPLTPPLSSTRVIHHYPADSLLSSPSSSPSQILSKLRRANDELCEALARSEIIDQPPPPPHYHIHHYPLSQPSYQKHRSRSSSGERSSPIQFKVSPKTHKARVTYKIHIPARPHRKSSRDKPVSDVYSSDEPIVIDLYPTRDQGLVKGTRKHTDNENPWIVNGTSIRRNSYSDTSISQSPKTPKGPYYGDKPIKSSRRSSRDKERPSSGSQRKPLSGRTTVRTDDPKFKKRVANAESKVKSAWEPTVTSLTQPTVKESQPIIPVEKTDNDTQPKSKVPSNPPEPPTPIKKVIPTPPPATNTDRSSLNDVPRVPTPESTPRNETNAHENNESVEDLFENESHTSEPSEPPPHKEKTPTSTPKKPPIEPPKSTVPEPDKGTKPTIKDGVLVHGNETTNNHDENSDSEGHDTQSTPPKDPTVKHNTPPLKPTNNDKEPDDDNEGDENDQEVAHSFDIQKWLSDASQAILGPSGKGIAPVPSIPPKPQPQPQPKPKAKSPTRRKIQPPSPEPDENLYKPPFGPKKEDKKTASSPPPPPSVPPPATTATTATTAGETDEAEDFFS